MKKKVETYLLAKKDVDALVNGYVELAALAIMYYNHCDSLGGAPKYGRKLVEILVDICESGFDDKLYKCYERYLNEYDFNR